MRKLIIVADDYGYAARFNEGIGKAVEQGLATAVSVMVNRPYVEAAVLKNWPVSLGLHAEVLDMTPDEAGQAIDEQLSKFRSLFGRGPDFLNRHKNTPVAPDLVDVFVDVAKKYQLPLRGMDRDDLMLLRERGCLVVDYFMASYDKQPAEVFAMLNNLPAGVGEFMVHPGYFDPESRSSYNRPREIELQTLLSGQMQQILQRQNVELVTFEALARLDSSKRAI